MENIVSCNMCGTLEEQLFKLATIYNYSKTSNKQIIIKDDEDLNSDLKTLLKNKILILNKEEFNKILFTFYNENNNSIIPYIKGNVYINGIFQTNNYFNDETYIYLRNLFITDNYFYMNVLNIIKYIKHSYKNDNLVAVFLKKNNNQGEPDITYYNTAYELLECKDKILVILSDNMEWCRKTFSVNKNFYFIENDNKIIQLLIMLLIPNLIGANNYLSWWAGYLDNTKEKFVMPNIMSNENIKIINSIYI